MHMPVRDSAWCHNTHVEVREQCSEVISFFLLSVLAFGFESAAGVPNIFTYYAFCQSDKLFLQNTFSHR